MRCCDILWYVSAGIFPLRIYSGILQKNCAAVTYCGMCPLAYLLLRIYSSIFQKNCAAVTDCGMYVSAGIFPVGIYSGIFQNNFAAVTYRGMSPLAYLLLRIYSAIFQKNCAAVSYHLWYALCRIVAAEYSLFHIMAYSPCFVCVIFPQACSLPSH